MRISDWSSDVCSSDLGFSGYRYGRGAGIGRLLGVGGNKALFRHRRVIVKARLVRLAVKGGNQGVALLRYLQRYGTNRAGERSALYGPGQEHADGKARAEEHTSQLQSLMRISHAVFCMKKKPYKT